MEEAVNLIKARKRRSVSRALHAPATVILPVSSARLYASLGSNHYWRGEGSLRRCGASRGRELHSLRHRRQGTTIKG